MKAEDLILFISLESASVLIFLIVIFQVPIGDYLMRRRMRKRVEYAQRLRERFKRKYQKVGGSRWHGRN